MTGIRKVPLNSGEIMTEIKLWTEGLSFLFITTDSYTDVNSN